MTNKQLRRHIHKIRFNRIIALLFLVVAVLSFYFAQRVADHYYEEWIDNDAMSSKEQIRLLESAIDLYPNRNTGYKKILQIHLADGLLSQQEDEHMRQLFNDHQESLNKNPAGAAEVYRKIASGYICCYDAPAEERLEKAYHYFLQTKPYECASDLEITLINAYLKMGYYFDEYIWAPGSLTKPPANEVAEMVRMASAVLDALKDNPKEQLAYACCVKRMTHHHEELWISLIGQTAVEDLQQQLYSISLKNSKDPATIRLYMELHSTEGEEGDHAS